MPFPPPPTDTIDWNNVGFKVREVNGHIESTYNLTTKQWTEPSFVKDPFLRIHGMVHSFSPVGPSDHSELEDKPACANLYLRQAPGLNYGQQCYEGQKAFRTPSGQIQIFRPQKNALRLAHSASVISMPSPPPEHFLRCVHLAVALNAEYIPPHDTGAAMYIRPLLFGSSAQLGLNPPEEYTFCVYVMPTGVYHGLHPVDALILEDFDRAAPEGTGSAKVGGNYAPVLRFSDKARQEGFGITLHLDSRTRSEIDEFSTSGFIGVRKEGEQYTLVVPDSKNVIESVTSESICQIGKEVFGWKVEKRAIKYEELSQFVEVMAAGTAAALVPIKSITMRSRNGKFEYQPGAGGPDEPGECCVKLLKTLQGIQRGMEKDRFGWCEQVQQAQKGSYDEGSTESSRKERTDGVNGDNVHKLP